MINIQKHNHSVELMQKISEIALLKEPSKELGYQIYSDINHTWYLAYYNDKLVAFCSAIKKTNHISFSHDYVLLEYRNKGIYNELFKARMNDFNGGIKSVATDKSLNTFLKYGFKITKKTKNYTFLIK